MTPQLPPNPPPGGTEPAYDPSGWPFDPAEVPVPNLDELVVEDGKPMDSMYAERGYRLLTESLYASWAGPGEGRTYVALANVGWFFASKQPALVPDVLLSLDVTPVGSPLTREGASYYQWVYGKPPDLVIEFVSDRRGDEESYKMRQYARQRLRFYVIFDPRNILEHGVLRVHELKGESYVTIDPHWIPAIGLGLTVWQGTYQGLATNWLRWCDQQGNLILTGAEQAQRAQQSRQRAEQERQAAEARAARLAAQLRALGIEPEA